MKILAYVCVIIAIVSLGLGVALLFAGGIRLPLGIPAATMLRVTNTALLFAIAFGLIKLLQSK